jgi:hypothetical protein
VNPTTINRLVAERVMGWTAKTDSLGTYFVKPGETAITENAWNPAADMNQAMEVVDKMHGTGVLVSLEWKVNRYRANFSPVNDWKWRNNAEHLNPATAICLAALRAVGVPDEEVNRE